MKKLIGLTFQITKEEGDDFKTKDILDYVEATLNPYESKLKLKFENLNTKIFVGSQRKEQEEIRNIQNYYQKLYNEKTFFKNSESDDYYGNLEHFIFGGKLATGKSLPFTFKDGEDIAIVYVTFVTEDNKDEQNIKKMGQDFEAQFFKMPIQN